RPGDHRLTRGRRRLLDAEFRRRLGRHLAQDGALLMADTSNLAPRWDLLANIGKNAVEAYDAGQLASARDDFASELQSPQPNYGRLASIMTRLGKPEAAIALLTTMAGERAGQTALRDANGGGSAPAQPVEIPSGDAAEIQQRFL